MRERRGRHKQYSKGSQQTGGVWAQFGQNQRQWMPCMGKTSAGEAAFGEIGDSIRAVSALKIRE